MHLPSTRRLIIALALIASIALTGCRGASVIDDAGRGAAKAGDEAPIPGGSAPDLPPPGGVGDDLTRAEVESTEARGTLRTMIESDERTWVCVGLDVVEASSDGDLTFNEYAQILTEHGYGYVPALRVQMAFDASLQLLEGDLTQLQELACA